MNPANIRIPGIDVSHYQGEIDWQQVKDSGIQFAFIKATDGEGPDPVWQGNVLEANKAGIPFGLYHFMRPSEDPAGQAEWFQSRFETLKEQVGIVPDLPPVLDAELSSLTLESVRTFLAQLPGSILYTDPAMIQKWASVSAASELLKHPLWIAEYNTPGPPRYAPWDNWTFWQYGTGRVPGIQTLVDLDWFNGSVEDLQRFMNSSKLPT